MRTVLVALALLLLCSVVAQAANDQAFLAILAETTSMKMAGMPPMPEMPAMPDMKDLPKGIDLSKMPGMKPGGAAIGGMFGGPKRLLNVRLWSPGLAPNDATAYITPPAGLKQGDKLDLELYRPKPEQTSDEGGMGKGQFDPDAVKDFTIKIYWGSSATVKPGQPKIIRWEGMPAEQKEAMKKEARRQQAMSSYFYKPNWTTGYWPTQKQPGQIAKDASLVGNYQLTTTYTGNVAIEAPSNVDFLAPIDITSPDLAEEVALDQAIKFEWKKIPNALGLHASIFGMEGQNTMIIWSSSEVYNEGMMSTDWDYLQMAEVRAFVQSTVMMPGDKTTVTVPEGIFAKCAMPMMRMIGYGPGAALDKAQPLPRIQTKTTLSVMLGGMGGMAGMGE